MTTDSAELPRLLDRLEEIWRRQSAPLLAHLRPGLTREQMDNILEPTGLSMPVEGEIWWSWHDGTTPGLTWGDRIIGPRYIYMTLAECVEHYLGRARSPHPRNDGAWPAYCLPIATTGARPVVGIETKVPAGASSPVYVVAWGDDEESDKPKAPSLTQAVRYWITAYEIGAWRYDEVTSQWTHNADLIPPELDLTRLL